MMAVAYFQMHAPGGFWPLQNKGELAVLYCFVFLFISVAGGGRVERGPFMATRRDSFKADNYARA